MPGEWMFRSSSLTWFSCASSSICGKVSLMWYRVLCSSGGGLYLSSVGAIAVDWRRVDGGRVGTRGRGEVVGGGSRGPFGFHKRCLCGGEKKKGEELRAGSPI
jgi:hypothetical protein